MSLTRTIQSIKNNLHPGKEVEFIWRELLDDRSRMLAVWCVSMVMVGSFMVVAVPYAIGSYIDGLTNKSLQALMFAATLFVVLELSSMALGWLRQQVREYFFQQAFWYVPYAITQLYLTRPLSWLSGGTSEIDGGGVESLKDKVWNVIHSYLFQIVPGWGQIAFALGACMISHVWLGFVALLYIVIERLIGTHENKHIHTEMRPVIDQFKRWDRRMHEWWRNVDHVKSQGIETKILRQIKEEVQPALRGDDAVWRVYFARAIALHRIRALCFATVLYGLLGWLVLGDMIGLSVAVLVFFSFERIKNVLGELNDQQRDVQFNIVSIAKYRRILQQDMPFDYSHGRIFDEKEISIQYDSVSHMVGEEGGRRLILRDVCLDIRVGEHMGIIGPSGAGKSQLISLLRRASDPSAGRVLVSGHDLRDLCLKSFLRFHGVIMQKSEPFEGTVLENLLIGISEADLSCAFDALSNERQIELEELARDSLAKAGLDSDQFPNGLMTNIGYKGLTLSGGQQQRLQIAAAHMKLGISVDRPRMIVADEPTSSLDSLSEIEVMNHLQDGLYANTTVLMIAHRLSTVANMDRIVFVRPIEDCAPGQAQVTIHQSLHELYVHEPLFRKMADAQGFKP